MDCDYDDRLAKRRAAFIDAGRRLFIGKGFNDTSLADVVADAGGSLATLYKIFGNKAGLLAAVVDARSQSAEDLIADIGEAFAEPKAALMQLGAAIRENYFDEEGVAMTRIVISYSLTDPEFAIKFHREKMMSAQNALAELFTRWRDSGIRMTAEPDALAAVFLGMFVHELHSDAITHGTLADLEFRDLETKIDFFCRGAGLPC